MFKYELVPPKTDGSVRTIDIDENIMKMMAAHIKRQTKLRMTTKNFHPDYHDAKFVFCNDMGYPYIQKTLIRRMSRLLRKTSIRKEATPHIFRHTHVSMLAEAGVDLQTIMKRVGHDDPKTTLKVYMHVTEKMKQNATEKVQNYYSEILQLAVPQKM
jgi:integrase